jgi:hypothetical protein
MSTAKLKSLRLSSIRRKFSGNHWQKVIPCQVRQADTQTAATNQPRSQEQEVSAQASKGKQS